MRLVSLEESVLNLKQSHAIGTAIDTGYNRSFLQYYLKLGA